MKLKLSKLNFKLLLCIFFLCFENVVYPLLFCLKLYFLFTYNASLFLFFFLLDGNFLVKIIIKLDNI